MYRILISISLILICSIGAYGQSGKDDASKSEPNTIGLGLGMAYLINETAWAPGVHLHYSRALGVKQQFSIGSEMELVIGEYQHASVAFSVEYVPFAEFSIGYGPCLEFPVSSTADHGIELIHHIELSYEFDLKCFHLGPMIEYGFNREDQHFMAGIHTGYSF